jgi:hypothetical protein
MGNYLVFPSNFAFDSIDIYCNVMKLDDEGFPILIKDHVLYYEFYASYWLGQKLRDPRVAAFVNPRSGKPKYIGARTAIIHNEQTMQFDYDKFAIAALNRSLQGASFRYYGAYGTQANVYQWGL